MKANLDNSGAKPSLSQRSRGAALVLVLAFLVLITALVISFFTSVTTELGGAKQYAGGANAKQLADSAVQAVIGTLKLATSGTADDGSPAAWASQPGMIRTYNNQGNPLSYYKLYSSGSMVVRTPAGFNPTSDTDDKWATKPALYTDLNSPVVSGTTTYFPIIDGNAIKTLTTSGSIAVSPYLGYDANGDSKADVEGFSIDKTAPVIVAANFKEDKDLSPTNTPVPMPTKWIYVLRDGTLTAPDDGSTTTATFNNAPVSKRPTSTNPITGRIAYWTDDETCKVNINTASEGTYWDVPRTTGSPDKAFATNQPVNNEFQRYPGHPATTSLSPVFSTMWLGKTASLVNESIYAISPRVSGSGSVGGTFKTAGPGSTAAARLTADSDRLYASIDELLFQPALSGSSRATQGLTKTQMEQSRFFITANNRAPDVNLFNRPRVCIWPVSSGTGANYRTAFDELFAFCSTSGSNSATGRGNIYYFQRNDRDSLTKDLDQTTVGSVATAPGRNRMLLEYLRNLTDQPIPGFGGNFRGKYNFTSGAKKGIERDQILTEIFDYIRCINLNDKNLTRVSGSAAKPFAPAFPSSSAWDPMGTGQVVPIQDNTTDTRGFGRFPTIGKAFFMFIGNAQNPPAPSASGTITFVSPVTGETLVSSSSTWVTPTLAEMKAYNTSSGTNGVVNGKIRVQAGFFVEPFCASYGHINIWPKMTVQVDNLDKFQWGPLITSSTSAQLPTGSGTTTVLGQVVPIQVGMGMPSSAKFSTPPQYPTPKWNIAKVNLLSGGNLGFISLVLGKGFTGSNAYPFVATTSASTAMVSGVPTVYTSDLDASGLVASGEKKGVQVIPDFFFSGGFVTIKLYNAAGTEVVQTGTITFPSGTFPVPKLAPTNPLEGQVSFTSYDMLGNFRYFVTGTSTVQVYKTAADETARIGQSGSGGRLSSGGDGSTGVFSPCAWIIDTDVVRSMEVDSGDVRLVAAQPGISSKMFVPHAYYSKSTKRMAHSLRGTWNNPYYGATIGRLVNLALASAPLSATEYTSVCSMVTGTYSKWRYSNNTQFYDPGSPSITGTGIYVGGSKDPRKIPGDWDNGPGSLPDGPYINRADEGDGIPGGSQLPYYVVYSSEQVDSQATLFSPNRQVPSAVMFGSLPSGIFAEKAWQTLLFRPLPLGHPGLGSSSTGGGDSGPPYVTPPDHLLLDLFNMPIVEPYPISEPLSTAGRINMNYQIAPFTYINRDTGIRAVLKSEQVIAIADSESTKYKASTSVSSSFRYPINMEETLKGFTTRFNNPAPANGIAHDLFRSASEICSIHLVPQDAGATYASMGAYWSVHRPTGDNSRERVYATVYPRLTTKSNTYTVHFRVQTLKKSKNTNPAIWDEKKDAVMSEYRGSQTIERYVDASDPNIPDYADPSKYNTADPIDKFYKCRILSSKKFSP